MVIKGVQSVQSHQNIPKTIPWPLPSKISQFELHFNRPGPADVRFNQSIPKLRIGFRIPHTSTATSQLHQTALLKKFMFASARACLAGSSQHATCRHHGTMEVQSCDSFHSQPKPDEMPWIYSVWGPRMSSLLNEIPTISPR